MDPEKIKTKPEIEEIIEEVKGYVNTSMELYKMKATEKGALLASGAIINLLVGVFLSMILLFASLALAFCLSEYFDEMYSGFLIVAGLYVLVTIVILLLKDKWLKVSITDTIIKVIYSH